MEEDDANVDFNGNYLQPISESEIKEEIKRIVKYNKEHPNSPPIDKYDVYDELMSKSKSKRAWSSPKKTPRGWLW
jgi:hypothetical protein